MEAFKIFRPTGSEDPAAGTQFQSYGPLPPEAVSGNPLPPAPYGACTSPAGGDDDVITSDGTGGGDVDFAASPPPQALRMHKLQRRSEESLDFFILVLRNTALRNAVQLDLLS